MNLESLFYNLIYSNGAYLQIPINRERIIPIKAYHLHKSRIKEIQRFYEKRDNN